MEAVPFTVSAFDERILGGLASIDLMLNGMHATINSSPIHEDVNLFLDRQLFSDEKLIPTLYETCGKTSVSWPGKFEMLKKGLYSILAWRRGESRLAESTCAPLINRAILSEENAW